jgi:hypothetical protein
MTDESHQRPVVVTLRNIRSRYYRTRWPHRAGVDCCSEETSAASDYRPRPERCTTSKLRFHCSCILRRISTALPVVVWGGSYQLRASPWRRSARKPGPCTKARQTGQLSGALEGAINAMVESLVQYSREDLNARLSEFERGTSQWTTPCSVHREGIGAHDALGAV